MSRYRQLVLAGPIPGIVIQACVSEDSPPPAATPSVCLRGTVWAEDLTIINAPGAGEDLTVKARFGRCDLRTESYQEVPGQPLGCRVNLHYASEGELTEIDAGTIDITGDTGPLTRCTFTAGQGYRCTDPADALPGRGNARVTLTPSSPEGFRAPEVSVIVGSPFTLDDASRALLVAMPTDGSAVTLSCTGAGGACPDPNDQAFTWVDLTTTDADLTSLGPLDLPYGRNEVSVRCMSRETTGVTIPADAMSFLRYLPPTRIRTEVARAGEGWSASPDGGYTLQVRAGHGVVGFTTPPGVRTGSR